MEEKRIHLTLEVKYCIVQEKTILNFLFRGFIPKFWYLTDRHRDEFPDNCESFPRATEDCTTLGATKLLAQIF